MEIILLLVLAYAIRHAWKDSRAAWGKSKAAYMARAAERFPAATGRRRVTAALRHDIGYLASHAAAGFPSARHGFAAGWHQGRAAQAAARTAVEEARTRRLENQAEHAEALLGFRERQQEALRRWREAMDADRQRTTEGTVTGEGTGGGGEGSPGPRTGYPGQDGYQHGGEPDPSYGMPADENRAAEDAPGDGRTYSWGPAASPFGWPAGEDAAKAHRQARHMSTDSTPQVVTEYPPGGGPGTTIATYLGGKEIRPDGAQVAAWAAEAEEKRRKYAGAREDNPAPQDDAGEDRRVCGLCGLPPAPAEGFRNHARCDEAYERDFAAHEIVDNRDLEDVERDLREQDKCPWQVEYGNGRGQVYCGQPLGGNDGDEFCLRHQAEAWGTSLEAEEELHAHVRGLLEAQPEQAAAAQGTPTEGEQHMASDVTYDSVIASMKAEKANAEQRVAEQQKAAKNAGVIADQAQGLEVDPATLSAIADHLDAHDAATKAQQRVQETAEAVDATLKRGHAGLAEAHQDAPVRAATRDFYQG